MRSKLWHWLNVAVLALACAALPARAGVIGFSSDATVSVQELVDGVPGSFSSDGRFWDGEADVLPLEAFTVLRVQGLDGLDLARGEGTSIFEDPRRLDEPNPQEFALEVAAFSRGEATSYLITAEATEVRTLLFAGPAGLIPGEISFDAEGRATVESVAYVSGAVLLWSQRAEADLAGLEAEVSFTISRTGVEEPVFAAGVAVEGDANLTPSTTTTGPLVIESGGLELLEGQDDFADLVAQLEGTTVWLVLIPAQEHVYPYEAVADEAFNLTAELRLEVRNAPAGTGAAAVLGRPFADLATFVEQVSDEVDGAALQRTVNGAVAERSLVDSADGSTPRGLCGALGGGGATMLGAALAVIRLRGRRGPARGTLASKVA